MKRKLMQIVMVLVFILFLYRAAVQNDLLANEFQSEIADCLTDGYLPIVLLSQESGEYQSVGESALWAAQYAVDKVNDAGGVNGCKVKLIIGNTNSENSRALSLYEGARQETFVILGPIDAPETAYITANAKEDDTTVHLAAYSYEGLREERAPYGICYMSDTADGELTAVTAWAEQNPDIDDIVLFTMSEDESQENTTQLFQNTLDDIGLNILEIVDVRMNAQTEDYVQYAIQALNCKADGYVFLIRGKYYGNILVELRKRGVEDGRRVSASFSAWDSDLADMEGEVLDGTYIWNKFDPFYQGEEWQELLSNYGIAGPQAGEIGSPMADYYDAVTAICRCYEEFGVTSENYRDFLGNEEIVQWFYNSEMMDGIQKDFYWSEGKKVMDYQMFVFEGTELVNLNEE